MARRQVSIYINGKEVSNSIRAITSEKRKLNAELERMVVGTDEYVQATEELRRVNGILDEHRRNLSGVGKNYEGILSGGISKLAPIVAGAFSADIIVSYGKHLFDLSTKMEVLEAKARTVFAEAFPIITAEAERNATAMGLTTSEYINAAAAVGDLLIPMGFQREEAANVSSQLVNLSGALSEWTGGQISAQEVSDKLANAMLGEREELKALGISISAADVEARLAAEGMDKLTGNALAQAEAMATLKIIMEKSVDAQVAYAGNTDTMVRKQAELRARFQEIAEKLSTALVPVFDKLLVVAEAVTEVIGHLVGGFQATEVSSNKASQGVANLQSQFNIEIETLKRGNLSHENRKVLIDQINSKYESYLPKLIDEKDSLEKLTAAQNGANKAFRERITLLAFQEKFEGLTRNLVDAKKDELDLQLKLTQAEKELEAASKNRGQTISATGQIQNQNAFQEYANLVRVQRAIDANIQEQKKYQDELAKVQKLADQQNVVVNPVTKVKSDGTTTTTNTTNSATPSQKYSSASDVEKQQQEIQKILEKYRIENLLTELSEDDQKIERLRAKYDAELATIKELEAKNVQGATEARLELERIKEQAINELSDQLVEARLLKESEDREKLLQEQEKLAIEAAQKEIEARALANELINDFTAAESENAIQQLDTQYATLLAMAEKFGIDTTKIQEEYARRRALIVQKEKDETINAKQKEFEAIAKGYQQLSQSIGSAISTIDQVLGEHNAASKVLALSQVAINSAEAIASATAASAGVPFPGNLAAIASAVATVLAQIASARRILNSAPEVKQGYTGGLFDVTGAQDGKGYSAQYIGNPGTGFLPNRPVLLASERGQEYLVSNAELRNPTALNYVRAIENIRANRLGITPQFADGGSTGAIPGGTPDNGQLTAVVNAVIQVMSRLNNNLEQGIEARIGDDTIVGIQSRFSLLNKISGGSLK